MKILDTFSVGSVKSLLAMMFSSCFRSKRKKSNINIFGIFGENNLGPHNKNQNEIPFRDIDDVAIDLSQYRKK